MPILPVISAASREASRLARLPSRLRVSIARNLEYNSSEAVLFLEMEGTDRSISAAQAGDVGAWTVGSRSARPAR